VLRRAADHRDAGGGGAGALLEGGDPVGERAQQALHVGAGDVLAGGGGAAAGEGGAGGGPVRRALPVGVGQPGHAVRAGHRRQRQRRELVPVHAEQRTAGLEDAGGVDGGGHGQEAARRVGEAGDGAGGVVRLGGAHHGAHAGGADRDGDVPLPQ